MIAKAQIDEVMIAGRAKINPVRSWAVAFLIPDPCSLTPVSLTPVFWRSEIN